MIIDDLRPEPMDHPSANNFADHSRDMFSLMLGHTLVKSYGVYDSESDFWHNEYPLVFALNTGLQVEIWPVALFTLAISSNSVNLNEKAKIAGLEDDKTIVWKNDPVNKISVVKGKVITKILLVESHEGFVFGIEFHCSDRCLTVINDWDHLYVYDHKYSASPFVVKHDFSLERGSR